LLCSVDDDATRTVTLDDDPGVPILLRTVDFHKDSYGEI